MEFTDRCSCVREFNSTINTAFWSVARVTNHPALRHPTLEPLYTVYEMTSTSGTSNLTDRFEIVKDIGDGSFGNVVLAKVRGAGSNIARRGTLVRYVCCLANTNSQLTRTYLETGCD